ncbi:MAG TPA: FAD-dependent oxidoreductase [Gammaproteobacteria bacterium]|nr:FAD-dependent oxidoreductase [Gammaproteobacteria bacterium]
MRIAVIGSGIAGLTAAWTLARQHEVWLYESEPQAGGHSNTVDVTEADGQRLAIDTGFIVYNERNYPGLKALFAWLQVPTRPSDMSFAASINDGQLEYAGDNLNTLFGQRRNTMKPQHWRMLADILRFNREGKAFLQQPIAGMTLGEFLDRGGYGQRLRDAYLLPMGAAIWSCPLAQMLAFPAESFLRFFDNHALLDTRNRPAWRTVSGGSRQYVDRLLADFTDNFNGKLLLNQRIGQIRRLMSGVHVIDANGQAEQFDQLVMATHPDQALPLLSDASDSERELLSAFQYQPNRAILHSDSTLMPRRKRVWASWNYSTHTGHSSDQQSDVSVSYWMNRLQNLPTQTQYFVSLNPVREPDPACVHFQTRYMHPVFTQAAIDAQGQLHTIQGRGGIWYCGAWCGYGFHEDGLQAGLRVADALGVAPPWQSSLAASG